MTLEEIGKKFGVTRERIRQIETAAIQKLAHSDLVKELKILNFLINTIDFESIASTIPQKGDIIFYNIKIFF